MQRRSALQAYLVTVSALTLLVFILAARHDAEVYANPWLYGWLLGVGVVYRHLCSIQAARGISAAGTLGNAVLLITYWFWGLSPALVLLMAWVLVDVSWQQRVLSMTNLAVSLGSGALFLRHVTVFPVMLEDGPYVAAGLGGFIVTNIFLAWLRLRLSASARADAYQRAAVGNLLEDYFFDLAIALTVANAYGASGIPGALVVGLLLISRYRSLQKTVQLQNQRELSIRALVVAMEARDAYTSGHSERVAGLARDVAMAMGLSPGQVAQIWEAGLLHDIGKVGIPDGILCKAARLTDEEYRTIQQHASCSEQILRSRPDWQHLAEMAGQHHEWYNGGGYPRGLAGEAIRLEARILCVADAYDAMTTDRPYRPALPQQAALAEISRCAGRQFDPHVAGTFVAMIENRAA